uniref:NADH-ubiquinone oxidoreductase chain 3 n=1 Tax=Unionicola foili TaxID=350889 RepID=B3W616_9ACAR|nr:NADH dehydrogenase subunit 3 [Unionicola foili]ACF19643.1 NADH dehydrogenase subunit 3 [Unionicola foili]
MILSMTILIIMLNLKSTFKEKKDNKKEKSSSFECGFNPQSEMNTAFSSQFFMIALLFLIFDMEICLLIPFISNEENNSFKMWSMFLIMMTLIFMTFLEWEMGMIEWSK